MKKAVLFPFNKKLLPVARHFQEMQRKYKLAGLITLPGTGLAGKDVANGCNQPNLGIQVRDTMDIGSSQWDVLILAREHLPEEFDEQELVRELLSCGKEVVVLVHSISAVPQWMNALYEEKKLILFFSEQFGEKRFSLSGYEEVHTPVLLVGGMVEEADVLDVTIAVTKALKNSGLIVETITKESVTEIFGFLDFEPFYSKKESEEDKILKINHMLRYIEKFLLPDIIVVEAPDAVIRYNDLEPNGFGIKTYMFCQAAQPDYMVFCMPYDLVHKGFIEMLNQDFSFRYGTEIGMIHASNVLVDSVEVLNSRRMSVFYDLFDRADDFVRDIETGLPICNAIGHPDEFGIQLQSLLGIV